MALDPAVSGLIGVLIGGGLTALAEAARTRTAFRRDKGWELVTAQRLRLEELYQTLEEVAEGYGRAYGEAIHVAGTQTMPPGPGSGVRIPWARLRMLTNLYVPALKPAVDGVYATGMALGSALGDLVMDSKPDAVHNAPLFAAAEDTQRAFNGALDTMRVQLEEASRALVSAAMQDVAKKQLPGR